MAFITDAVDNFVSSLASIPSMGRKVINSLLAPAFAAELELRTLFVLEPDHPCLRNPYVGLIDAFSTPIRARRTWPRTQVGTLIGYQVDPLVQTAFPLHYLLPLDPLMRRPAGSSCMVENIDVFMSKFNLFTNKAFSRMRSWDNMVVAGGSVLACLTPLPGPHNPRDIDLFFQSDAYRGSDVDIFLFGLTPKKAKEKMVQIYDDVCLAISSEVVCVRKANTITIHGLWPTRPIQIVLRLYRSPAEIAAGFDVDSSCCLFDGFKVWLNPRAFAALIRQCNTVDMTRRSPSYEVRLAKYADRGFEIYLPSLRRENIDYAKLYDRYRRTFPAGLARLIVLERIRSSPFHYLHLYAPVRNRACHQPVTARSHQLHRLDPVNFGPIERLLANNYDFAWIKIPYGKGWTPERIRRLVNIIDHKMNSPYNTRRDPARTLHRHAASCGNMAQCLYSSCCFGCPQPQNDDERELVSSERLIFIRGHAEFITIQPGRQLVSGSFRPVNLIDWSSEAYVDCQNAGEVDSDIREEYFIYLQNQTHFL